MASAVLKLNRTFVEISNLLRRSNGCPSLKCGSGSKVFSNLCAEDMYRVLQWCLKSKKGNNGRFRTLNSKVCRCRCQYHLLANPSSRTCHFASDQPKLGSKEDVSEEKGDADKLRISRKSCWMPEDFFGVEDSDGVVIVEDDGCTIDAVEKYSNIFYRKRKADEEKVFVTNFGSIRYDSDNKPQNSTTHSKNVDRAKSNLGIIEEQYFSRYQADEEVNIEPSVSNSEVSDLGNFIDEQYFSSRSVKDPLPYHMTSSENISPMIEDFPSSPIRDSCSIQKNHMRTIDQIDDDDDNNNNRLKWKSDRQTFHNQEDNEAEGKEELERWSDVKTKADEIGVRKMEMTAVERKSIGRMTANIESPKTAFDFVARLRAENWDSKDLKNLHLDANEKLPLERKTDSEGHPVHKDQIHDLDNEPAMMVLQILKDSIIFNECDIVALSKPYGLPTHYGEGHRHCLTNFLPELAMYLCKGNPEAKLYTVHRLDKETTGVILLAKTQIMAQKLHLLLAERKIVKTYWALTKGVPSPLRGIVDIPISEGQVEGKSRMVLRPEGTELMKVGLNNKKKSSKSQKAVTEYTVLASHGNAALVELKPLTGVRHQIRVHLAAGLGCPVLGDHKFSHRTKLAPQKLPSDMLDLLGVRQSKVRYIPMHLHARAVVIPEIVDGRDIHIGARLPRHFKRNMRHLKLKKEEHKGRL